MVWAFESTDCSTHCKGLEIPTSPGDCGWTGGFSAAGLGSEMWGFIAPINGVTSKEFRFPGCWPQSRPCHSIFAPRLWSLNQRPRTCGPPLPPPTAPECLWMAVFCGFATLQLVSMDFFCSCMIYAMYGITSSKLPAIPFSPLQGCAVCMVKTPWKSVQGRRGWTLHSGSPVSRLCMAWAISRSSLGSVCPALQGTLLSTLSTWPWPRKPLILWQAQVWYFQLWTNLLGCFLLTPWLLVPWHRRFCVRTTKFFLINVVPIHAVCTSAKHSFRS